jgi:plasmid stabilization system protein ParE
VARSLEVHPAALSDAVNAAAWYRRHSPNVAVALELERAMERIEPEPLACPPHIEGTWRFIVHRFHCDIVFRLTEDRTLVGAVASHRQRPGYWAQRLEEG